MTIGRLAGDVLDLGERLASVHMLRRPPAWCVDAEALAEAERLGARMVTLLENESGQRWTTCIENFRRFGIKLDRGFGEQVALTLDRWDSGSDRQLSLLAGGGW